MASNPVPAFKTANPSYFHPFHWREAALCAPAMPLLILVGIESGHPIEGATAAGAALAVGFGAARELKGRRWGAMIAAMVGMAIAAFAGCLLGQSLPLFVLVAGMAAAICAAFALYDEDLWWVILQIVIAYLIAGYYAGPLAAATDRGLVVLIGGAIQIGIVRLLASLFPAAAAPTIVREAGVRGAGIRQAGIRSPVAKSPPGTNSGLRGAHMIRAAICVMASLLVTDRLGLSNSYWAPMTALIVLKPRLRETHARGLARLVGTLAGCTVATLYAHVCGGSNWFLGLGMAGSAMAAYALQKAHYASLTAAITATVVLLLSLGHVGALANAEHRLVATLVGGGIALAVAWVVPRTRRISHPGVDRVGT